jgi:hypothetical protein
MSISQVPWPVNANKLSISRHHCGMGKTQQISQEPLGQKLFMGCGKAQWQ